MPVLEIANSRNGLRRLELGDRDLVIGRTETCDIVLPAHMVSRRHARIVYRNGQHMVEDLGSTNGTFVNRGRRLLPGSPQVLNDGDEIIVGKTFLRFKIKQG